MLIRPLSIVRISRKNHPISSVSIWFWMDYSIPYIISYRVIPLSLIAILRRWTILCRTLLSSWTFQSGVTKWKVCQKPVSVSLQVCQKFQPSLRIRWLSMSSLYSISYTPWSQMVKQPLSCQQDLSLLSQGLIKLSVNTWWTIKCWLVSFPCRPLYR